MSMIDNAIPMIPAAHNTGYNSIGAETAIAMAAMTMPRIPPDLLDFQSRYPATIARTLGTSRAAPNTAKIQAAIVVRSPIIGIPLREGNVTLATRRKMLHAIPSTPKIRNKIEAAEMTPPL